MKKRRNKVILFSICGLLILLICGLALHRMMDSYKRKADAKEFVDYLIEHADEASADFETCGLVFSVVEKGDMQTVTDAYTVSVADADMLIVTDVDGWRFYYQPMGRYGDRLIRVEGSVERVRGGELLTGNLSIERWEKNKFPDYAYVVIECDTGKYWEIRTLNYRIPEFDEYWKTFKAELTADQISQWISAEELSALYKSGKELEEILSAYCSLKRNKADVAIQYTPLYRKATP